PVDHSRYFFITDLHLSMVMVPPVARDRAGGESGKSGPSGSFAASPCARPCSSRRQSPSPDHPRPWISSPWLPQLEGRVSPEGSSAHASTLSLDAACEPRSRRVSAGSRAVNGKNDASAAPAVL